MSALSNLFRRKPRLVVPAYTGWVIEHSPPMRPVSFPYDIPADGSLHYITRPSGPLTGKKRIIMRFRWAGVAKAVGQDDKPARLHLYFQRRGDPWTYAPYRFWSKGIEPTAGGYELSAELAPGNWTTVNGQHDEDAFKLAINETMRIGVTFGGGDHNGHGVFAFPSAIFNLLEYVVE